MQGTNAINPIMAAKSDSMSETGPTISKITAMSAMKSVNCYVTIMRINATKPTDVDERRFFKLPFEFIDLKFDDL